MKNSLIPHQRIVLAAAVISALLISCKDKSVHDDTKDEITGRSYEQDSYESEVSTNSFSDNSHNTSEDIADETSVVMKEKSDNQSAEKVNADIDNKAATENKKINRKPVHLTKQDFLDKVMDYEKNPDKWVFKGDLPCLIDFYADWCAPCRITAPILDELAESYAGKINIYKIDIEREKELSSVFGIQSIPAFLYCPVEGRPSISSGIARTAEETRQLFISQIESLLLDSGNTSEM